MFMEFNFVQGERGAYSVLKFTSTATAPESISKIAIRGFNGFLWIPSFRKPGNEETWEIWVSLKTLTHRLLFANLLTIILKLGIVPTSFEVLLRGCRAKHLQVQRVRFKILTCFLLQVVSGGSHSWQKARETASGSRVKRVYSNVNVNELSIGKSSPISGSLYTYHPCILVMIRRVSDKHEIKENVTNISEDVSAVRINSKVIPREHATVKTRLLWNREPD
jgi:hypothetical protein